MDWPFFGIFNHEHFLLPILSTIDNICEIMHYKGEMEFEGERDVYGINRVYFSSFFTKQPSLSKAN